MPLFRQHLRRTSMLYSFGIVCFAVWSIGAFVFFCLRMTGMYNAFAEPGWVNLLQGICAIGIVLFWATILKDVVNPRTRSAPTLTLPPRGEGMRNPPRFWHRLLIPILLYLPVLLSTLMSYYAIAAFRPAYASPWISFFYNDVPLTCVCWFAPLALGTFVSLYVKKLTAAISVTGCGSCVLFVWALMLMIMFGCSPWWTTIPICFALLFGARIKYRSATGEQAAYRYRWMPLVPIIGTILAILLAFPFVRFFSIPDVSWQEIAECLEKAQFKDRLSPEKRRVMLESLEKHHIFPLEFRYAERRSMTYHPIEGWYRGEYKSLQSDNIAELLRQRLQAHKEYFADPITYEEHIFGRYHELSSLSEYIPCEESNMWNGYLLDYRLAIMMQTFPWERERMDRILRLNILSALVEPKADQTDRTQSLRCWFEKHRYRMGMTFENFLWEKFISPAGWDSKRCRQYLNLLFAAVNCYRAEHGEVPKTLDDLLGNYLDVLPVDPETGALPELLFDESKPKSRNINDHWRAIYWGDDPFGNELEKPLGNLPDDFRGTVLRLGEQAYGILDPPEEEKQ